MNSKLNVNKFSQRVVDMVRNIDVSNNELATFRQATTKEFDDMMLCIDKKNEYVRFGYVNGNNDGADYTSLKYHIHNGVRVFADAYLYAFLFDFASKCTPYKLNVILEKIEGIHESNKQARNEAKRKWITNAKDNGYVYRPKNVKTLSPLELEELI